MLLNIFYSTTNIFTTNDACPAHLLHPEQLGVAVLVGDLLHDVEGEGADLLEGVDGDLVLQPAVPPLLQQVIVHLARADQDLAQTQHIRTLGEQEQ